ncbi:MAG: nucleoside-diphosphate kinase [Rickettsiales bacterium]|nr:nucleoside-diphosphate kinase [Rickettsiales bacterium]
MERTLSILKPDALKRNLTGKINAMFEENGLKIIAQKMILLTKKQAEEFYEVHLGKPFYEPLVNFMISGPIIVQILEGDDAVQKNRIVMGKTNFVEADEGTIRKLFATSIRENCVHGSDSVENAKMEIEFFFNKLEIF